MSPFIMCDLTKTKYQLLLHNSITIWHLITKSHSIPLSQLFLIIPAYGVVGKILLLKVLIPASDVVQRAGVALVAVRFSRPPRPGPPIPRWARHTVSLPPLIWWLVNKKHWKSEQTTNTKYEGKKQNNEWRHLSYDVQGQSSTNRLTPKIWWCWF